jgi:circadian clock protein KaiC
MSPVSLNTQGQSNDLAGGLTKCPTGIKGLDEITQGGLPRGRSTLVIGNAGCGKTLLGLEFLVRGIQEHGEPGLFVAFEETATELTQNVRSLGWDLEGMMADGVLMLDHVHIDPSEIIETGAYDLEGLFIRLGACIEAVGARRVVLDTIESLFSGFHDAGLLRAELRRLITWLKGRGVTTVFTGELDPDGNTRHGIEDYVSDCVIWLDHRIIDQISTRRLRVAKYRGSSHGTNEYPFIISQAGFEILPITSVGLTAQALTEHISTGIPRLDDLFGGEGPYRGSSVLIAGTAGTGKSSIAAHFLNAACQRGERALYLSFEESPAQMLRNMRSIGLDLARWQDAGLLTLFASRPTAMGLDAHLVQVFGLIKQTQPRLVVIDPLTHLSPRSQGLEQTAILVQLLDYLKAQGITAVMTDLTRGGDPLDTTSNIISSLVDSWLVLRAVETDGERNRLLYLLKSRGMAHSNQLREFRISAQGIDLLDVYLGPAGVLTGSARFSLEAQELAQVETRKRIVDRRRDSLARQRQIAQARIAVIQAELAEQEMALEEEIDIERVMTSNILVDRAAMSLRRGAKPGDEPGDEPADQASDPQKLEKMG